MRLHARSVILDRKNMTDNLEEYQDWIEYGVAVGLGRAIEIILGVENDEVY